MTLRRPVPTLARLPLCAACGLVLALALGACAPEHPGHLKEGARDAPKAAERACRQRVKARTGDKPVRILSSDPSGGSSLVRLRDHRDAGTWRCTVDDRNGRITDMVYNAD
ncbi:hypothetical protein [uncultured Albimonas sp.]|uniref:hypothetical protein n=1 Tax=uncultured Albimonas sp. TaxID=1331701 RepID=UPI0030ED272E